MIVSFIILCLCSLYLCILGTCGTLNIHSYSIFSGNSQSNFDLFSPRKKRRICIKYVKHTITPLRQFASIHNTSVAGKSSNNNENTETTERNRPNHLNKSIERQCIRNVYTNHIYCSMLIDGFVWYYNTFHSIILLLFLNVFAFSTPLSVHLNKFIDKICGKYSRNPTRTGTGGGGVDKNVLQHALIV